MCIMGKSNGCRAMRNGHALLQSCNNWNLGPRELVKFRRRERGDLSVLINRGPTLLDNLDLSQLRPFQKPFKTSNAALLENIRNHPSSCKCDDIDVFVIANWQVTKIYCGCYIVLVFDMVHWWRQHTPLQRHEGLGILISVSNGWDKRILADSCAYDRLELS